MVHRDRVDLSRAVHRGPTTRAPRHLSLALVLAACGSSEGAKEPDAATPAGDAAAQPVTVTVTVNGQPIAGVHTYFLDPADAPIATVDTDATGTALAMMPVGGSVTALDPFPIAAGTDRLVTIAGAKPGDHLLLGTTTGKLSVTLRAPIDVGAVRYDVFTTCGDGSLGSGTGNPSGLLSLEGCRGTADIAIVSNSPGSTGMPSTPLSGLYHPGAAVVADGVVDLTAETYAPLAAVTFTYLNAPDAPVSVAHAPVLPHGPLGPFSSGVEGGTATILEPTVPATNSTVTTRVALGGDHIVIDTVPSAASYTLDFKDVLLPDLPTAPSFELATGHVSWAEGATGATPDLTVGLINVRRGDVASGRRWFWTIIAPYKRGDLALPRLPTDVFAWTPTAGDQVGVDQVSNAKATGGYDAIRARALGSDQGVAPGERLVSVVSPN